ncbi:MAG: hypothetical protein IJW94_05480 [Oscillospiraceae bacterium]|nr:hypothetical protein [Oscillospiraceae bacterium]
MKIKTLSILWADMFLLCAGLGFIPNPQGVGYGLLVVAALAFFVPPALILVKAKQANDKKPIRVVRNLSIAWLSATLIFLVANFASIGASAAMGTALYYMLIVISSPMICGQIWVLSLFLWACLLMASLHLLKK